MDWIRREHVLPHVLRRRAEEHADRVYFRHVDGETLTYQQSYEDSLRWAAALRRLGVHADRNVLSMLPNSIENYHVWLGISWLGAIEVSLNTAYQGRMLHYTVSTADADVLVVSERFLPALAEIAEDLTMLRTVVVPDLTGEAPRIPQRVVGRVELFDGIEPYPPDEHGAGPQPWDTGCIIWTSGTTGPSKGVMVPWAELYHFCEVVTGVTTSEDVLYHFLPAFHVGGKVLFYSSLLLGGDLVLRESFSTSRFWTDVRDFGVTHTVCQAPMVNMLMNAPVRDGDRDNPLRTMGCAPLPDRLEEFTRRFGVSGVNTYYGMTEIGLPFASEGFALANGQSCGRVRDGYEARIVDEHDYPVPHGQVGELIVRAHHPWVMNAGYHDMPDKTAEAWRNGWFHTGDAFRVDEGGNFYFVDRFKDALRRRGENISSFEVEAYVSGHPDVTDCAAVAARSELGEDDVKIVVVRAPGSSLGAAELVEWLQPQMPRFMVPRYVEFVDNLPRTEATHKVKKAELRARGVTENTWDREAKETTSR